MGIQSIQPGICGCSLMLTAGLQAPYSDSADAALSIIWLSYPGVSLP